MPNRIIRESCTTSETLAKLSDGAERLFWRLTTKADDFGRFESHPRLLMAGCFPLFERLKLTVVAGWLSELSEAGLVLLYRIDGKHFGYFVTWDKHQRVRNKRAKFPDPPPFAASRGESRPVSNPIQSESESESNPVSSADAAVLPVKISPAELFEFYNANRGCLPEAKKLLEPRREQIAVRLREPDFQENLRQALDISNRTPFLSGSKGWKPNLDWFIANSRNVYKVIEGSYDDSNRNIPSQLTLAGAPQGSRAGNADTGQGTLAKGGNAGSNDYGAAFSAKVQKV